MRGPKKWHLCCCEGLGTGVHKIRTRHGEIKFSISERITLNPPMSDLDHVNALQINNKWYCEKSDDRRKLSELWNEIDKIDPKVSFLWIIRVEDGYEFNPYLLLIVDSMRNQGVCDYLIFYEGD